MDPPIDMIRAKIKSGVLPGLAHVVNTWYGRGSGRPCIACEQRIELVAIEVEADLEDGRVLCLHASCYRTWEAERRS